MRDIMKSKNTSRGEGDEEEGDEEEGEDGKGPAAATVAADSSALALVRIVLDYHMLCLNVIFCHFRHCSVCFRWFRPSDYMPGS